MIDDVKLRNKWLSALLPALMVLMVLMLAACSSTDEAAQPDDTSGQSCIEACGDDLNCKEHCL
jgi:hypothetical protein